MNISMNSVATAPNPNAIGMPENSTSNVAPPYINPSWSVDIQCCRCGAEMSDSRVISCASSCNASTVMPSAIAP